MHTSKYQTASSLGTESWCVAMHYDRELFGCGATINYYVRTDDKLSQINSYARNLNPWYIEDVTLILSPSTAALPLRKPAPAGTSCDRCRVLYTDKGKTM